MNELVDLILEFAGEKVGVSIPPAPDLTPFETTATVDREQGTGLEVAKDSMRHSSIEMTLHYTHKKLESVAGAIARLPDFLANPEQKQSAETQD